MSRYGRDCRDPLPRILRAAGHLGTHSDDRDVVFVQHTASRSPLSPGATWPAAGATRSDRALSFTRRPARFNSARSPPSTSNAVAGFGRRLLGRKPLSDRHGGGLTIASACGSPPRAAPVTSSTPRSARCADRGWHRCATPRAEPVPEVFGGEDLHGESSVSGARALVPGGVPGPLCPLPQNPWIPRT